MQQNNDILSSISFDKNEENNILDLEAKDDVSTKIEKENNDILNIVQEIETISINTENEIKEEENEKLQDVLMEFSTEEKEEEKIEATEKSIAKKTNMFISSIVFLFKYILTSSFIFAILLVATNYNSYIEIARSYINPEALEVTKNSMYASINSTSLSGSDESSQENSGKTIEEEMKLEEKMNMVKNKTYHSMEKLVGFNNEIPINIEITPYENRIIIPKIGKNIPLIDVEQRRVNNVKELEDVFMKELINGVVRYPGSAKPGEDGDAFIFGHSSNFPWLEGKYNDVFALLDNVAFGDDIIVYYNQKKYTYKIKEKKVVKPGDTSVLKKTDGKKEISLMTCWPVGTTLNRMVVTGELVQ